jgi:hypothetical protein
MANSAAAQVDLTEVLARRLDNLRDTRPRRWVAAAWRAADDCYFHRVGQAAPTDPNVHRAVNDYLHARDALMSRWPGSEIYGRATWGSTSHDRRWLTFPQWASHAWWQFAGFIGARRYSVRSS